MSFKRYGKLSQIMGSFYKAKANKALQMTQTALGNFGIFLSHNGLRVWHGSLPVVTARFGQLSAGVSHLSRNIGYCTVAVPAKSFTDMKRERRWPCVSLRCQCVVVLRNLVQAQRHVEEETDVSSNRCVGRISHYLRLYCYNIVVVMQCFS